MCWDILVMILELVLLICAGLIMAGLFFRFNHSGRLTFKIPGPKGIPIFGNMLDIMLPPEKLFRFGRNVHKKHGNFSKLQTLFIRGVNIYEPADAEVILSATKFNEKRIPYTFLTPWLGQGLLINKGGKNWSHRRKMLTPAFHFNILKKFTSTFNEQTTEFIDCIKGETDKDKSDVILLVTKCTLRIMCETSMGTAMDEDIQSVSDKYLTALHVLGNCAVYRLSRVWLWFDLSFLLSKVAWVQKTAIKDLQKFTKQIIRERREYRKSNVVDMPEDDEICGKKSRLAMLDLLLDQEKQGKIDDDGIREEVDTFMFEGHDTTAMALCFMIMRIANEPEVQENIHQELCRVFGDSDRDPTIEDLAELKYLECCIKESLRLYPSVPYIARYLTEEVTLSGYRVPSDTICSIHIYDMHRREDLYPEPEKFIPERFLPENITKRHPYAFIPFSAGPRNCIGQKFAILEMKTMMSGLLRKFRLEAVTKPEECRFIIDLVLRTKNPIYVRFRNRKK